MTENRWETVKTFLEEQKPKLKQLSLEIWKNPELAYEEKFAHDYLTNFLEQQGFEVERSYKIPTAFRANYKRSKNSKGPTIAILCEYDALPNIGHGCGHNLIAACGVGAGIAVKNILENNIENSDVQLVVLGTPAEEQHGGKIKMIELGAFEGIDMAMMAHPAPGNFAHCTGYLNRTALNVKFRGNTAHAANYPWHGQNALDAVVQCYTGISNLRQQMKTHWRVHMIITEGGQALNCIPEQASMKIGVRALSFSDIITLTKKIEKCINAAALASGCQVEIEEETGYKNVLSNYELAKVYKKYYEMYGESFFDDDPHQTVVTFGSTDMGDVSYIMPGIHPKFFIGKPVTDHTPEFAEHAKTDEAQDCMLKAATSMACTALEVAADKQLFEKSIQEYKKTISEIPIHK